MSRIRAPFFFGPGSDKKIGIRIFGFGSSDLNRIRTLLKHRIRDLAIHKRESGSVIIVMASNILITQFYITLSPIYFDLGSSFRNLKYTEKLNWLN